MSFVNEFVHEEDIKSFDLDALWNSYHPFTPDKLPVSGFRHTWTVDRERGIYFMLVNTVEEIGPSGRNEPTNRKIFILNWKGTRIEIQVALAPESTLKIYMVPFKMIWELIEIDPTELPGISRAEIIQTLKDALTTYGLWGAHKQVPNTIVDFKF